MESSYTHQLAGLNVKFPYEKPYAQQKVMMCRLITALKQRKNCLIESPTGTGKSLSLLCGALSYCEQNKNDYRKAMGQSFDMATRAKSVMDMYDDEVKIHSKKMLSPSKEATGDVKLKRPPKIFYGTRTHRQVSQVVKEFNRTGYRTMKMTILGSRDRMCVNPRVVKNQGVSVSDGCRNLRKLARHGAGCSFYHRLQKQSRYLYPTSLQGSGEPWDIEDIALIGKRNTLCPYYWSIQLAEDADIIFCPYNYILDPRTRKALDINLEDNIVILDEAHNIEDICRDSMSLEIKLSDVLHIEDAIETSIRQQTESAEIAQILPMIGSLRQIMQTEAMDVSLQTPKQYDDNKLCQLLDMASIGPRTWSKTQKILSDIFKDSNEDEEEPDETSDKSKFSAMDARGRALFEGIANTMHHMYKLDQKYLGCFKGAISKQITREPVLELKGAPEIVFQIYCLNPAVGLIDIKGELHSLVVASGTLSPMQSFQCELDVPFPVSISLGHVVKEEQMFACVVSRGPSDRSLVCDYKNNSEFSLQDDLGRSLLRICARVPHGVLCFFPSYSLMNKLKERWEMTNTWVELERLKGIYVEGSKNFQEQMDDFYSDAVSARGALLMAVCRGRVSEGEDFPDNLARAVVIIGIPFPNSKQVTIGDKMTFNDGRLRAKELVMSGSEWYKVQAFRALNQALGRCIRHCNDWGAIILLEERISAYRGYRGMLSKWVRERLVDITNFNELEVRLEDFVQNRTRGVTENSLSEREEAKVYGSGTKRRAGHMDESRRKAKPNYAIFTPPMRMKSQSAPSSINSNASMSSGSSASSYIPDGRSRAEQTIVIEDSPEKKSDKRTDLTALGVDGSSDSSDMFSDIPSP